MNARAQAFDLDDDELALMKGTTEGGDPLMIDPKDAPGVAATPAPAPAPSPAPAPGPAPSPAPAPSPSPAPAPAPAPGMPPVATTGISASDLEAERGRVAKLQSDLAIAQAKLQNADFVADKLQTLTKDRDALQERLRKAEADAEALRRQTADPKWKETLGEDVHNTVDAMARARAAEVVSAEVAKLGQPLTQEQIDARVKDVLSEQRAEQERTAFRSRLIDPTSGLPDAYTTHADPEFQSWLNADKNFRLDVYNKAVQSQRTDDVDVVVRLQKNFKATKQTTATPAVQSPAAGTTAGAAPAQAKDAAQIQAAWHAALDAGDAALAAQIKSQHKELFP